MAFLQAIIAVDRYLKIEIACHNSGGSPFHPNIQRKPLRVLNLKRIRNGRVISILQ